MRNNLPGLALMAAGLMLCAVGTLLQQNQAVLQKAIRICMECVGIG